jgi:hypothetical protein
MADARTCKTGVKLNIASSNTLCLMLLGRPQLLRGLRHEMPSLARTLESWVRILLKAWMSVCVFSVFMCRWRPCDGLITRPRSPTDCL